ncbi:MAG: adenosylcobinamide-GDP ribazoletransferase [Methylophilus sp.]|nr:adenosylcobinamide-GDP ribazoletransferase [Methylophilus sp.]
MLAREWRYFLLALGFFTRIPTPHYIDFQEAELNHAAKYFPLVGVVVGLVGAVSFVLARFVLPQAIAVLVSMAATIYLTGAFHEDGLADSADGLGGGWEREQMLTIMQDSRIGTYGVVALVGMLIAKFQALSYMPMLFVPLLLIAGHALSRLCAVWIMATAEYAKPSGKAKPLATHISKTHLLIANVLGLLPWLSLIGLMVASHHPANMMVRFVIMTLVPVLIAWVWWRAKLLKHLHGYTGDTLGATQQITELMFYLGALAWSLQ